MRVRSLVWPLSATMALLLAASCTIPTPPPQQEEEDYPPPDYEDYPLPPDLEDAGREPEDAGMDASVSPDGGRSEGGTSSEGGTHGEGGTYSEGGTHGEGGTSSGGGTSAEGGTSPSDAGSPLDGGSSEAGGGTSDASVSEGGSGGSPDSGACPGFRQEGSLVSVSYTQAAIPAGGGGVYPSGTWVATSIVRHYQSGNPFDKAITMEFYEEGGFLKFRRWEDQGVTIETLGTLSQGYNQTTGAFSFGGTLRTSITCASSSTTGSGRLEVPVYDPDAGDIETLELIWTNTFRETFKKIAP